MATVKANFSEKVVGIDGVAVKETSGVDTVARAILDAGVSQMVIDKAIAALRPFWGTGEPPKSVELTLGRACANALQQFDADTTGAQKVDRFRLALRVMGDAQPVELSETEKEQVLKCVDKLYGPIVYARVYDALAQVPEK